MGGLFKWAPLALPPPLLNKARHCLISGPGPSRFTDTWQSVPSICVVIGQELKEPMYPPERQVTGKVVGAGRQ